MVRKKQHQQNTTAHTQRRSIIQRFRYRYFISDLPYRYFFDQPRFFAGRALSNWVPTIKLSYDKGLNLKYKQVTRIKAATLVVQCKMN